MAKLYELITEKEAERLNRVLYNGECIDFSINVRDMTVQQLSNIALVIVETEHNGRVPACVLSAEAINILTNRAIEKGIPIL